MSQQFLSKYFKRSGDADGDPPAAPNDSKSKVRNLKWATNLPAATCGSLLYFSSAL